MLMTNELLTAVPAWGVMWLLAVGVFAACKVLTYRTAGQRTSAGVTAGYLFGWPGLDVGPFVSRGHTPERRVESREWIWAGGKTLFGAVLIWVGVRAVPTHAPLIAGWVGIIGLGFLLHFGAFHLLANIWRAAGYDVQPLMDAPHRSTSLAEFWSRRWNLAFRDLSHRFIFRPLRSQLGVGGAMLAVFLFSGLVHDLVISVPAGGGYGLPTAYFLVQAAGLLGQRSRWAKRWSLHEGFIGWAVTATFVLAPLPWLFHRTFVLEVVMPFLKVMGAMG
ncbi:MAG: membrane bound O-acyl transferase family-domain-containing protein [Planctomycetaceae bacterium]|nr:membrane bound O-acyl transferase family-domain-containing protein [Planctomycetaceae bacterium]